MSYAAVHSVSHKKNAVGRPDMKKGDQPPICSGVIFSTRRERMNGSNKSKRIPVSTAIEDAGDGESNSVMGGLIIGFINVLMIEAVMAVAFLIHHIFSLGGCAFHFSFNLRESFLISITKGRCFPWSLCPVLT